MSIDLIVVASASIEVVMPGVRVRQEPRH